jgi:hypothetical protein
VAKQFSATSHVQVDLLTADLTSRADVRPVEQRLRSDASLTHLVNNAGIVTPKRVLVEAVDWLEGSRFAKTLGFHPSHGAHGKYVEWVIRRIVPEKRPSLTVNAPRDWLWKSLGRIVAIPLLCIRVRRRRATSKGRPLYVKYAATRPEASRRLFRTRLDVSDRSGANPASFKKRDFR